MALLAAAGFGAGAVNAVGGGGSLISFPALLAAGYPSIAANVTNAVALLPGYLGGSLAYRPELARQRARIRALAPTSALGAAAGAALLLVSPASLFEAIVPWLILAACALLALQPRAAAIAQRRRARGGSTVALHAGLFAATLYGGYFGAGLGIVLLALLGALLPDDLQRLNALKGLLSLLVAVVSAAGLRAASARSRGTRRSSSAARACRAALAGVRRRAPAAGARSCAASSSRSASRSRSRCSCRRCDPVESADGIAARTAPHRRRDAARPELRAHRRARLRAQRGGRARARAQPRRATCSSPSPRPSCPSSSATTARSTRAGRSSPRRCSCSRSSTTCRTPRSPCSAPSGSWATAARSTTSPP